MLQYLSDHTLAMAPTPILLLGNFNAYSPSWGCTTADRVVSRLEKCKIHGSFEYRWWHILQQSHSRPLTYLYADRLLLRASRGEFFLICRERKHSFVHHDYRIEEGGAARAKEVINVSC